MCGSCYQSDWLRKHPAAALAREEVYQQRLRDGRAATASWRHRLKKRLGVTEEQYILLFAKQEGCCAICGRHATTCKKRLALDHNHLDGRKRGLLCDTCNRALGLFSDSPERLRKAAAYLEQP